MKESSPIIFTGEEAFRVRKKLGMTQEQFSQLLNVTVRTVVRWEAEGLSQETLNGSSGQNFQRLREAINDMGILSKIRQLLVSPVGLAIASSILPIASIGAVVGAAVGSVVAKKMLHKILDDILTETRYK